MTLSTYSRKSRLLSECIGRGLFGQGRFNVLDVGASGGIDPFWRQFEPHLKAVGFDPLVSEVERLNRVETNPDVSYAAAWIGNGARPLPESVVPEDPRNGSGPGHAFALLSSVRASEVAKYDIIQEHFNSGAEVVYSEERISLDEWLARNPSFGAVDVVKCDVDSYDFEVWVGAQELLSAAERPLALITEAQLHEMRGRRGTVYGDIDRLMRDRGYRLADIEMHRYTRAALPGHFAIDMFAQTRTGAVQACDAVYVLDPVLDPVAMQDLLDRNDPLVFLKLIVLYDTFNLHDYAAALLVALRDRGMRDVAGLPIAEALDMLVPKPNVFGADTYEDYIRRFEADPRQLLPARVAEAVQVPVAVEIAERQGPRDWTLDMSVGEGCQREGRAVRSPKGVEGHMVFGPYARLSGGDYVATIGITASGLEAKSARPSLVLELVAEEEVIDVLEIPVSREGAMLQERAFVVPAERTMQRVQLRLWVPAMLDVTLDAVTVTRLPRQL